MPMIIDALDESGLGVRTIIIVVDQTSERDPVELAESDPTDIVAADEAISNLTSTTPANVIMFSKKQG